MANPTIHITHDGSIDIATGRSRKETTWNNRPVLWSVLLSKIAETHRTAETYAEYVIAKKDRQDEIKDIGGFVGGYLANGRRKAGNVLHRQLLTLDVDNAATDFWQGFTMLYGNAAAIYSTHKHSPEKPRLRLLMPLSREVASDEYEAIGRRIAGEIGIDQFDSTTYQAERLMYWPSTSKDGVYEFQYQDGPWLDVDEILKSYHNWKDCSEWPYSTGENAKIDREIKKQGDPLEKPGIIGDFNRTYTISEAIEEYLSDVYERCDTGNRYTYRAGSTWGGLVVYDDKFAYSHHSTDPASGKLCNAFDLVRIHKYGLKDEGKADNKASTDAMKEAAAKDKKVLHQIGITKRQDVQSEFGEALQEKETSTDWLKELDADSKGRLKSSINNYELILLNEPAFSGLKYDSFLKKLFFTEKPVWQTDNRNSPFFTDVDLSEIIGFIEKFYGIKNEVNLHHAMKKFSNKRQVHPIKEFIKATKWDGVERLERLLIDYLGAEDNQYTRTVTRRTLVAAVARVFQPGIKFDTALTLVGPQGAGKSTLLRKLGGEWFTDSFHTVTGKEAFEQILGFWIVEIAELSGLRRHEIETVKHYLSKTEDNYRAAYGRTTEIHPRQCIFIATTNTRQFLKDATGNRRFWPVTVDRSKATKDLFSDLDKPEIEQLWAEAYQLYKAGEMLYLDAETENLAREIQQQHFEADERVTMIEEYLNTPVPDDWKSFDTDQRENWVRYGEKADGVLIRNRITATEIWVECFKLPRVSFKGTECRELQSLLKQLTGWVDLGKKIRTPYGILNGFARLDSEGKPIEEPFQCAETSGNISRSGETKKADFMRVLKHAETSGETAVSK